MRVIIDQGWFRRTLAPAGLLAGIVATGLAADALGTYLDTTPSVLGGHEAVLIPAGGPPPPGRIRLGLAWYLLAPANLAARNFLKAQVVTAPGVPPAFTPAAAAEIHLASQDERSILVDLHFPVTASGGPASDPLANVRTPGHVKNTVFVEPHPRRTTLKPGGPYNVRADPSTVHPPIGSLTAGTAVNVAGTTDAWSAIDFNGKLGFVRTSFLLP